MKHPTFFLLIMLLLPPTQATAQDNDDALTAGKIDQLFQQWDKPDSPGAAVLVIEGGKTLYKKCFGCADLEQNVPITTNTSFNLASVAKQFTAFAILLLEKEGRISLEDDVHKYLTDLPPYSKPVTIRNLLNHTSGIWEYYSTMVYYCGYDKDDHFTLDEDMELLKRQEDLLFEPGSQWSYCNSNYLLLAQVVERITGVTFQEWTRTHIFEPLGMKNSFFMRNSSEIIVGKAKPYRKRNGELVKDVGPWTNAVGMGYLFTNIEDMILWMDNFRTMNVGGKDVVSKMFQKTKLNDGSESFYGFGLGVLTRSGKLIVGHSGQTAGYKTAMLYCPELDLGITVLANERSIDSEGLANTIFDLYTGKAVTTEADTEKKPEFLPFNPEAAAKYAGGYIVEGANAKLAINVGEGYLHCAFFGMGEDYFYPMSERSYANRSRVNLVEFEEGKGGTRGKAILSIHGKKMTASPIVLDAEELASRLPGYMGDYYSSTFGVVYSVHSKNGGLVMHHRRYGDMRMKQISADEFFFELGFVKFKRDRNEEITGFTLIPSDEKFCFQGIEFVRVKANE